MKPLKNNFKILILLASMLIGFSVSADDCEDIDVVAVDQALAASGIRPGDPEFESRRAAGIEQAQADCQQRLAAGDVPGEEEDDDNRVPASDNPDAVPGRSDGSTELFAHEDGLPLRLRADENAKKKFVPANEGNQGVRENTYLFSELAKICEQEADKPWSNVVGDAGGSLAGSLDYLMREIRAKKFIGDNGEEQFFDAEVPAGAVPSEEGGGDTTTDINATLLSQLGDDERTDEVIAAARYKIDGSGSGTNTNIKNRIKAYVKTAYFCAALGSITGRAEYDGSGSQLPPDPMAQCQGQPNPQQCAANAQQSMSGFTCVKVKNETQDYQACRRLEMALAGFYVGQEVHNATQVFRAQDSTMNEQLRMQQQMQSGEGFSNRDAMETQRRGLVQQRSMANERAAFSGAETAAIMAIVNGMPTNESLKSECTNSNGVFSELGNKVEDILNMSELVHIKNAIRSELPNYAVGDNGSGENREELCAVASSFQGNQLIKNGAARDRARSEMARAGAQTAADLVQAALLGDMIGKLDQAIADWEEPEDPNFEQIQLTDTQISECVVNPDLPMCAGLQGTQRHGFNATGINISTGTPNALGTLAQAEEDGGGIERKATSTNRPKNLPTNIGSITENNSRANEFIDEDPGVGALKDGQFNTGGGGGGAGGGGASQPGASGGSRGGGGGGEKGAAAGRGVKLKMAGGQGIGSLRGGKGVRASKSNTKANPFSKLAKKKKGGVVKFRGPASQVGGKKGNIWSMLSNRYSDILAKDRLKKYEIKK